VELLPQDGGTQGCELQIRPGDGRAQFAAAPADGFAADERSLREGGAPHQVGNYAVEHLVGTDRPFTVRVLVRSDDKIGGTLVDAEIAGQRTMITYRPELAVARLILRTEGAALTHVEAAPLADAAGAPCALSARPEVTREAGPCFGGSAGGEDR
jgi:hypothetical protein